MNRRHVVAGSGLLLTAGAALPAAILFTRRPDPPIDGRGAKWSAARPAAAPEASPPGEPEPAAAAGLEPSGSADPADVAVSPPADATPLPITGVRIPRLGLDAPVVPARIISVPGGATWEVPPFKVGHGALSAGAGATGNAILFGHLTSLDAGNVFRYLHLA